MARRSSSARKSSDKGELLLGRASPLPMSRGMLGAKHGELQVAAQVWRIEGYNGDRLVMSETLSFAAFSEKEIVTLLQRTREQTSGRS